MKRFVAFLVAIAAFVSLSTIGPRAQQSILASCIMKPNVSPLDSTYNVLTDADNTNGWPAQTWTITSYGGYTTFTIYTSESDTIEFYLPDGCAFSCSNMPCPFVSAIKIERENIGVYAAFVGFFPER